MFLYHMWTLTESTDTTADFFFFFFSFYKALKNGMGLELLPVLVPLLYTLLFSTHTDVYSQNCLNLLYL